jgi:hypothetical protein
MRITRTRNQWIVVAVDKWRIDSKKLNLLYNIGLNGFLMGKDDGSFVGSQIDINLILWQGKTPCQGGFLDCCCRGSSRRVVLNPNGIDCSTTKRRQFNWSLINANILFRTQRRCISRRAYMRVKIFLCSGEIRKLETLVCLFFVSSSLSFVSRKKIFLAYYF